MPNRFARAIAFALVAVMMLGTAGVVVADDMVADGDGGVVNTFPLQFGNVCLGQTYTGSITVYIQRSWPAATPLDQSRTFNGGSTVTIGPVSPTTTNAQLTASIPVANNTIVLPATWRTDTVTYFNGYIYTGDTATVNLSLTPTALGASGTVTVAAIASGIGGTNGTTAITRNVQAPRATWTGINCAAPTTTLLTALPVSPSESGTNVTFTAEVNVTSGGADVTAGNVKFYDAAPAATCTSLGASTQIGADQALSGTGTASVSTSALSIAAHTILACYQGTSSFVASGNSLAYTITTIATSTGLSALPASPSESGTNVAFTAHVTRTSDSSDVTTGNVKFYDGAPAATCTSLGASTQIGADQALDGSGNASVNTSALTIAGHTILACYQGTATYVASGNSLGYTITTIATSTGLTPSPASPQEVGTDVTFTAHVTRTTGGSDVTSGNVKFYDAEAGATCALPGASAQIGSDQALDGSGNASVNTSTLTIATHTVLACYQGTATYATSGNSVSYEITTIATTTDLTPSPASPQEFGTDVTFTAHVEDSSSNDVTSGNVKFWDAAAAATCDLPGTSLQIGSDQALDGSGDASVSTTTLSVATHTILACYQGTSTLAVSGDSISYTITTIATDTDLTVTPSTQQYSDKVSLTADITPSAAPGSVQFSKSTTGCAGSFSNLGAAVAVVAGQAVLADQVIGDAAGTSVCFKAEFTSSDSNYAGSSDTGALTVTKEDATILYGSGNPSAAQVTTAGSGSWNGPLVLLISVTEKTPDLAALTAAAGDINNAGLTAVLSPIIGGSNINLNCVAGTVVGTGYGSTKPFTCTSPGAIPLGAYEVQVNVTGDYYTAAQYLDAFTVYDPSLGFATGGGWFMIGSDKVNFGLTTKYNKNGTNPQGGFIAVRHYADGTIARLKSNSLSGLAITTDGSCGNAQLFGKATFTKWDPTANGGLGAYVTTGNNLFSVSAWDCNQPGTGFDKIWINGVGDLKMAGTGSLANATVIGGGNIAVPHKAAR